MINKALNFIKVTLSQTFVIYVFVYLFFVTIVDQDRLKAKILNVMSMPITDLVEYTNGEKPFDRSDLLPYIEYYRAITTYAPNFSSAHGMLGLTYHLWGDDKKAIQAYKSATELNQEFFWFYFNLGALHYNHSEYDEAIESFQKALQTEFTKSIYFIYTAKVFRYLKNEYRAQTTYEIATKTFENEVQGNLVSGHEQCFSLILKSYYLKQDYQNMIKVSLKYAQLRPHFKSTAYFYAGVGTYRLKDYQRALAFLKQSIEENPNNAGASFYMGLTFQALRLDEPANEFLNRAKVLGWDTDRLLDKEKVELKVF